MSDRNHCSDCGIELDWLNRYQFANSALGPYIFVCAEHYESRRLGLRETA